jgi:type II secretory ATPase GspE/PulE/Tfp pilus assembly ATPase PilB-like protein
LTPYPKEVEIRWRVDGVLESLGMFPVGETTDIVARLKVLAGLLTYRQEIPQEGRLRTSPQDDVEMRVSTFPTLFGLPRYRGLRHNEYGPSVCSSRSLCPPTYSVAQTLSPA